MWIVCQKAPNYLINEFGQLKHKNKDKVLKIDNSRNYPAYKAKVDDKLKTLYIHILIGIHYIPNPNNYKILNHKDLNKQNFVKDNLEWTTQSENIKHYWKNKNLKKQQTNE